MKIIKVPFSTLDHIVHLADVHIRLFKRHAEYREVFDRLFGEVKSALKPNTVIAVLGDVLHSKSELSPEMIELASYFLRNLADIAPTLLIAGNHDANLSNSNRLDSLSPIVANLNHPHLHYLRDSGVFRVADVDFAVLSQFGEQNDWPTASDCTARTKIAMFHGPVDAATTDVGYRVSSRNVNVNTFDGYDIVLLGDIHKRQTLQHYDKTNNKPIISYVGSLVQQNHGELPKGHGWAEWNVASRTVEFHELYNRVGYYTLRIENGKVPDYSDMPTHVRLRIFAGNMEQSAIKTLVTEIRKTHKVEELSVSAFEGAKRIDGSVDGLEAFLDVHDVEYQNKLIADYVRNAVPDMSEDTLQRVLELNAKINTEVTPEELVRNVRWEPISLKFDNLFTYGPGNFIDFTTLRGVAGLFAPNASGKTSIAEAICFALYDRTPRTSKAVNIMNRHAKECSLEFRFSLNGTEYLIIRKGKRDKAGKVSIGVDFYKFVKGERICLNGEQRVYTDKEICKVVGEYEDFVLTTFSSSAATGLFVDKGQSDRKDLLSQFMGLSIFDKLYTLANEESKDIASALKRFKTDDFTVELAAAEESIASLTRAMSDVDAEYSVHGARRDAAWAQIQSKFSERKPVVGNHTNLSDLTQTRDALLADIEREHHASAESRADLVRLERLLDKAKNKLVVDYKDIEVYYDEYKKTLKEKESLEADRRLAQVELRGHQDRHREAAKHTYDPTCEFCIKNGKSTIETQNRLSAKITEWQARIDTLTTQLNNVSLGLQIYEDVEERYQKFQKGKLFVATTEQQISSINLGLAHAETRLSHIDGKLKHVERAIQDFEANREAREFNVEIEKAIATLEATKSLAHAQMAKLNSDRQTYVGQLALANRTKQEMQDRITQAAELETKYETYEAYLSAVHRDGLPYKLISEVLPQLQSAVNNVLAQMVEFNLLFSMDGKNVNMELCYDAENAWPLEMASGMEKFVSGLAIRVALASLSSLPKSSFLILDEGLGALDGDKLAGIYAMFDVLRTHFTFIMLISHVDAVRDVSDVMLEIKRTGNISQIVHA